MLSYPDRQRFEEIRARWEAAQILNDETQANMVGRKEKAVAHQPADAELNGTTSKFRRKLSYGLSFISYPLSQRRTTPARPSLSSNGSNNIVGIPHPHQSTKPLSPTQDPSLCGLPAQRKATPSNSVSPQKNIDTGSTTPKSLPRSRTMSFIPRPSRSVSASSTTESDSAPTPRPPVFSPEQEARATPTKIPSPGPPVSERRKSSPRQYYPSLTSQQAKHVGAGNAFAAVNARPASKSSVRSYTTPNLVKGTNSPGSTSFMAPRKLSQQKVPAIPAPQKPTLKENTTPVSQRYNNRLSQIKENSPRRGSPMAPTAASKSRSLAPVNALAQSKRGHCTTPPTASKRKSSLIVTQTPLAAQRALPKKPSPLHPKGSLSAPNGSAVTQTRLLGPVSPPTPPATDRSFAQAPLPRANTDKDSRKRGFTTPYKRIGAGMLSRSQAGANNEVRLPRSSTYYDLGDRDIPPPMPPIPEQYKSVSMPLLGAKPVPPKAAKRHRKRKSAEAQTIEESDSYSTGQPAITNPDMCGFGEGKKVKLTEKLRTLRINEPTQGKFKSGLGIKIPRQSFSASSLFSSGSSTHGTSASHLGSAKNGQFPDSANIGVSKQVKDYMPALYWAGRFQSRFDQWRTEAMQVELVPGYKTEGMLAQCTLDHEEAAACYIFLQLRDVCLTSQAADSLWEFEYRYRQEHNLLGASIDLPPLNPKPDDTISKQGSFGRAVRKMTPRKSSFVNLLKGKGWNKDEPRSPEESTERDLSLTKTSESSKEDHCTEPAASGRGR